MKKLFAVPVAMLAVAVALGAGVSASAASVAAAGPAPQAASFAQASSAAGLAQPVRAEDVFIPITPCRIVDTRAGSQTPFGNGTSRSYYVGGTFGFAPQGGKPGGCGIPTTATAIAATITAVAPTNGGFVRAWPALLPEPGATILNYGTFSMGAGTTVGVSGGSGKALSVKNYGGPTDIVIDVAGYYAQQIQGLINENAVIVNSTNRVLAASRITTGTYTVSIDTDLTRCSIQAQSTVFSYYTSVGERINSTVTVYIWRNIGTTPTLTNGLFLLTVTC